MQRRRGAEITTSLVPMALGAFLAIAGAIGGSRHDSIIGVALIATGIVGLVAPRLAPPPSLSRERLRARRTAAVILPNGIIYLLLAILLRTAIPASERGGTTSLIAIFAFVMGVFSLLSGLGALARARRPDDVPTRPATNTRTDDHEGGNA
ncbi:MAG: hypothetical protein ACR2JW_13335 [Thermomicrobiales bacterium]